MCSEIWLVLFCFALVKQNYFSESSDVRNLNTFAASYLNTQGLNNSCLKSPASTKVDVGDFKHELLNRLRSTMAVNVLTIT